MRGQHGKRMFLGVSFRSTACSLLTVLVIGTARVGSPAYQWAKRHPCCHDHYYN